MYDIEIADQQTALSIEEGKLRDVVSHLLAEEQVREAEISIALVDNATIRELNVQYLQHDYDTDVLSFLLEADPPEPVPSADSAHPAPRGAGRALSGEVIVSTEMAIQMAADYDWSPEDELVLYLVHGLLHLCGYDDLTEPERDVMRAREREILRHWKLVPHYAESRTSREPSSKGAGGESAGAETQ